MDFAREHSNGGKRWLSRYWVHMAIGFFVVVTSFVYGLVRGLSHQDAIASAYRAPNDMFENVALGSVQDWPMQYPLPTGIHAVPMGYRIAVNGKPADIISFTSERPVKEIIDDQITRWRDVGLRAIAAKGIARGTGIAVDVEANRKLSITAWVVPPKLRANISAGLPVQGVISIHHPGSEALADEEEEIGAIPGIPIQDGAHRGSVVSSTDKRGRTYTAVYTNPGSVQENIQFYVHELRGLGWILKTPVHLSPHIRTAAFLKDNMELSILFAPAQSPNITDEAKTVATIILAPQSRDERRNNS